MRRLTFLVILLVFAAACGSKDHFSAPDRLLSEQEMIALLSDMQIIEADLNYQKSKERSRDDTVGIIHKDYVKLAEDYYNQLFDHYGITDTIFQQNVRYYTEHAEMLEIIMDSVYNRLLMEQSKDCVEPQEEPVIPENASMGFQPV